MLGGGECPERRVDSEPRGLGEGDSEESMRERAFLMILEKLKRNNFCCIQTHISWSPDTFRAHRCHGIYLPNIKNRFLFWDHAIWLQHWYHPDSARTVCPSEKAGVLLLTQSKSKGPVGRNSWTLALTSISINRVKDFKWKKLLIVQKGEFVWRQVLTCDLYQGHRKLRPFGQVGCHGDWEGLN